MKANQRTLQSSGAPDDPSGPESEALDVIATLTAWIEAIARMDLTKAASYYTASPCIVDGFAPYCWIGPSATNEWVSAFNNVISSANITGIRATLRPAEFMSLSGEHAHVCLPAVFAVSSKGHDTPGNHSGRFTLVLSKLEKNWKIRCGAWAPAAVESRG